MEKRNKTHLNLIIKLNTDRPVSRVAQWKRAGPITQRSVDRNHFLLNIYFARLGEKLFVEIRDQMTQSSKTTRDLSCIIT